jgi:hypothetical protein
MTKQDFLKLQFQECFDALFSADFPGINSIRANITIEKAEIFGQEAK